MRLVFKAAALIPLMVGGAFAAPLTAPTETGPIAGFTHGSYTRSLFANGFDWDPGYDEDGNPTPESDAAELAARLGARALSTGDLDQSYGFDDSGNFGAGKTDVAAGKVRTAAFVVEDGVADAYAQVFDVLTFDFGWVGSGLVTYTAKFHGLLEKAGTGFLDDVRGIQSISFVDVTGVASPFVHRAPPGGGSGTIHADGTNVEAIAIDVRIDGGRATCTRNGMIGDFLSQSDCRFFLKETDQGVEYDFSVTRTFKAFSGRSYAFESFSYSMAQGAAPAYSDLFGTSEFRFDSLSGGTFASASGRFLADLPAPPTTSPVPLPASLPLGAAALAALALLRRRGGSRA